MRLSTVFISSAFVLAGMSAALSIEKENMLVARFADSDFFQTSLRPTGDTHIYHSAEVEARAYDEELELYARGTAFSKLSEEANRNPIHRSTSKEPLPSSPDEDNRPQIYRSTRGPLLGSPPNLPKNWASVRRGPKNDPPPSPSAPGPCTTIQCQRDRAKIYYGSTRSNVRGRRRRSFDDLD